MLAASDYFFYVHETGARLVVLCVVCLLTTILALATSNDAAYEQYQ